MLGSYDNRKELSYCVEKSEEGGAFDKNEKLRYKIFIELQYDFQKSDERLIRFLLKQEIIARENDDFQGIGRSLWLGAYLLAKFKSPNDIPLFYRAKFANFDTRCGFTKAFMYVALRDKTEKFISQNYPKLYPEIQNGYSELNLAKTLDEWWNNLCQQYPKNEADESLLDLYERAIIFDNQKLAKKYLKKWENVEPESTQKENILKNAYLKLGELQNVIPLIKKELGTKNTNWDKVSVNIDLLNVYTKMDAHLDGLEVINTINKYLKKFDDWKQVGLGRMAVHTAFEYSLASKNIKIAKTVFKIAHKWFRKMDSIALVGLEAGWKAAEYCTLKKEAEMYKNLAIKEKERIKRKINKIKKNK